MAYFEDETIEVDEEEVPIKSVEEFEECLEKVSFDYPDDMVDSYHNLKDY